MKNYKIFIPVIIVCFLTFLPSLITSVVIAGNHNNGQGNCAGTDNAHKIEGKGPTE